MVARLLVPDGGCDDDQVVLFDGWWQGEAFFVTVKCPSNGSLFVIFNFFET